MLPEWAPATGLERALLEARQRHDHDGYLRLLRGVGLLVPVQRDASGRTVGWTTSAADDRTYVLAYTSQESLSAAAGGQDVPCATMSLADLTRRWPDPAWWLALNSGLPIEVLVPPAYLAQHPAAAETGSGGASVGDVSARAQAEAAVASPRAAVTAFQPANEVEAAMLAATRDGDTDAYLKALMLAEVLLPRAPGDLAAPGDADFTWPTAEFEGERCVPVFTSEQRLAEQQANGSFVRAEALAVIRDWPDRSLTLVLNPGTPVGASLPGREVTALAGWAAEIGLFEALEQAEAREQARVQERAEARERAPANAVILQKVLPPEHLVFYRERGYHMVSGHVHRLGDVGRGVPAAELCHKLGLEAPREAMVHVVRWRAYGDARYGDARTSERAGPQHRVSGAPLPHGATLLRIHADGAETTLASYDADTRQWLDRELP